jgi:membrane-associated phospholipid phosphatase
MRWIIIICLGALTSFNSLAQNVDIDLLKSINVHHNKSLDPTFQFITNSVTPISIAIPVGFITFALIKKDSLSKNNAILVCSSVLMAGLISTSLKYAVNRDRPFVTYPFIQKETYGGSPSFPSGHVSSAFALATSVSIVCPKWYVIAPSFLWAGAVGYSRMDLGVHYPSDVLAGAIIGSGSALLSYKLNRWINAKHKHRSIPALK